MGLTLTVLLLILSTLHGGGLDKNGCHNDTAKREYHCHQGPLAGKVFKSQAEAVQALAAPRAVPVAASAAAVAVPAVPYDRELYGHWIDADRDCQDTRTEVLIAESLIPAVLDSRGCEVTSGLWFDPYIGEVFTDPGFLEVDHVVALAEVHRSGGDRWTPEEREAYANDLADSSTLMAVSAMSNRSKSDKGPDVWMPINREYRCVYVQTWVEIKKRWSLRITDRELQAVRKTIEGCRRL